MTSALPWRARPAGFAALRCLLLAAWLTAQASHADTRFPDVLSATVRVAGNDRFDFDVTVSSPYDTPSRYADGFRVSTLAGQVLGERKLWHDHQHEQPFTRDLYGLRVPAGVQRVRIQARDQQHGYGGASIEVALPGRQP